jgi:hypothetical protein
MRERRLDLLRRARAHDDRPSGLVRFVQALVVDDVVEHERVGELELTLDRDLRDASPGCAEPALSHRLTDAPGSIACMSTSAGACCLSSSGVPATSGNVP